MTPDEILHRRVSCLGTAVLLMIDGRTVEAARWRELADRWGALLTMPVYGPRAAS